MGYLEGFEHNMFFRLFAQSLPVGFNHIVDGIPRREEWLRNNQHLLPAAMLLTSFSYLEGIVSSSWIETYGDRFQPELDCLRIIRNAITHNDGDISENRTARGLAGPEQLELVNNFVRSLELNEYMPLEDWGADNRSSYISYEGATVKLGRCAIGRIAALGHNILRSAGKIVYDEE